MKFNGKKKEMIEALREGLGIVTVASKKVGISRNVHYQWMRKFPEYKKEVEEVSNITLDFVENTLFKLIQEKNIAATIFYLKTKGRGRGYIERHEIKGDVDVKNYHITISEPETTFVVDESPTN